MKKIGISILLLSSITSSLFAKADSDLVDRYMQLSGSAQTIASISEQITTGIVQTSAIYGNNVDKNKIEKIEKIFAPQESIETVRSYLIENFNDKELLTIISFYKSNIGKDIVEASLNSLSSDATAQMLHFMADLRDNPPSKKRIKVIKRFIDVLDMNKIVNDIYVQMFKYLNSQANKNKKLPKKKVEEFLSMMNQAFEKQMFISTLYIYKDISTSDLYKSMKYYKSKAGETEKNVVRKSMIKMLKEGFKRAESR
jgi:hypothetical protein